MDAPTEWTYGGQLDWSSPESLKLAPVGMCLRCIIEAIRERWIATYFKTNASTWSSYDVVKDYTLQPLWSAVEPIQADIDNLIKYSLNHTEDPYIDGLELPVFWTTESLAEYLGKTSLTTLKKLRPLSSEWLFEKYQVLNMLKIFAPIYYMSYFPPTGSAQYEWKESIQCCPYSILSKFGGANSLDGDGTWNSALAAFEAAEETEYDSSSNIAFKDAWISADYTLEPPEFKYSIYRARSRFACFIWGLGCVSVKVTGDYKLYLSFIEDGSSDAEFDSHGDSNVVQNILKYQLTETFVKGNDFKFLTYIPCGDSFTEPDTPSVNGKNELNYTNIGASNKYETAQRRTAVVTIEPDFNFTSE